MITIFEKAMNTQKKEYTHTQDNSLSIDSDLWNDSRIKNETCVRVSRNQFPKIEEG